MIIRDNFHQFCTKHMVSMRNKKKYPPIIIKYPLLSRALLETDMFVTISLKVATSNSVTAPHISILKFVNQYGSHTYSRTTCHILVEHLQQFIKYVFA